MPQLLCAVLHVSKLRPALERDDPQPPKHEQRARFPGEINSGQKSVTSGSVQGGARISRATRARDSNPPPRRHSPPPPPVSALVLGEGGPERQQSGGLTARVGQVADYYGVV